MVLTDSGGIQEEAPTFSKPVLVLRKVTERPEASQFGMAKIIGMSREAIVSEAERLLSDTEAYQDMSEGENPYGDGRASERIVEAIARWHQRKTPLLDADKEFKLPPRRNPRRRKTDVPDHAIEAVSTRFIPKSRLHTMIYFLFAIVTVISVYTLRHYFFTLNRLFGFQRHPYIDIDTANWPPVTVLVAAHNEEKVDHAHLAALMRVNYPADKMLVVPVNDRSTDRTREIIDLFVKDHPGRIRPFHREGGKGGKAAALKDAMELVETEVILIFDADYIPGSGLVKQLVAPFFDPEVGGVMGRVVPLNVGTNLLTRLLDLERSGGYQVDQQARMNLRLVPQHGGTVAGVRRSALREIGGWNDNSLTEDTDLRFAFCWQVGKRYTRIVRSVTKRFPRPGRCASSRSCAGPKDTTRHWWPMVSTCYSGSIARHGANASRLSASRRLRHGAVDLDRLDSGARCVLSRVAPLHGVIALLAFTAYAATGNFAAFFEIAAAVRLDHTRQRICLLPFLVLGFGVSIFSVSRAVVSQLLAPLTGAQFHWDKTERFRTTP